VGQSHYIVHDRGGAIVAGSPDYQTINGRRDWSDCRLSLIFLALIIALIIRRCINSRKAKKEQEEMKQYLLNDSDGDGVRVVKMQQTPSLGMALRK
jgi:hypothetical protein